MDRVKKCISQMQQFDENIFEKTEDLLFIIMFFEFNDVFSVSARIFITEEQPGNSGRCAHLPSLPRHSLMNLAAALTSLAILGAA